ncbi:MAG: ATP-binding protein [candidate division KSB1 bacterium]
MEKYGKARPAAPTKFDEKVRHQYFALAAKDSIFLQEITQRRFFRGTPERSDQSACRNVFNALELRDFVAMPLVAKDRLVGLIIADNLYSNMPIESEQISLLELFASQAAQAIEKAGAYHRLEMEKRKLEHAYQELQLTHKRLLHSERLATIGNMAAHVAHEIRNPLVTIGGFTRSLQRQLHNPEAVRNTLNIISDEVVRLEKILADVLEFTRLPASIRQDLDLNQIATEVCTLLHHEAQNQHVRMHKNFDANVMPLRLDAVQIKQLLMNLMQNAIQAMPEGGELEVRTERLDEQRVRLSVRDTGGGIEPEVLEKIFTPFFTTKAHGTGLGLAICRQIVNEHGGEIAVNSAPKQGATFLVDLPTQQKAGAAKKVFDISDKIPSLRARPISSSTS